MKRLLFPLVFVVFCAKADTITGCCVADPAATAMAFGQGQSASDTFTEKAVFEIISAPGPFLYRPCLAAYVQISLSTNGSASASLLGFSAFGGPGGVPFACQTALQIGPPIGVPIPTTLLLSAFAVVTNAARGIGQTAFAQATFNGFEFFDLQGNPISNVVYSYKTVPTPEPPFWPLMALFISACCVNKVRQRLSP